MAKTSMKIKTAASCKVLYQRIHTLQNLWTSTFSFEKNTEFAEFASVN